METKLSTATTIAATTHDTNPKVKSSDWLDDADDWGSDEDLCDVANNCDFGSNQETAQHFDDPVSIT